MAVAILTTLAYYALRPEGLSVAAWVIILVGFAIGEPLNATTFVEHFEKGLPEFTGIYPFILNEFAKSLPQQFTHLNREQDLGLEGLRKSKESWNPEYLERKYVLRMKG